MKVILVNGSPNEKGCTFTALSEVAKVLQNNGIETEIMYLGKKPIQACVACGRCFETMKCFVDDMVNEFLSKVPETDGFIFGTPVHFAAASGQLTSFLHRAFYRKGRLFKGKPGACVVSCRRGGAATAFDQINKYFTISGMPIVSSQYWNQVHGNTPEEVIRDEEGMQTMRTLGQNMAWLLKCIEAGREKGIIVPEGEKPIRTNFIR
jgi:multimeric flavodoxin WrbA